MSTSISGLAQAGQEIDKIPVPINYDIIRLFLRAYTEVHTRPSKNS